MILCNCLFYSAYFVFAVSVIIESRMQPIPNTSNHIVHVDKLCLEIVVLIWKNVSCLFMDIGGVHMMILDG